MPGPTGRWYSPPASVRVEATSTQHGRVASLATTWTPESTLPVARSVTWPLTRNARASAASAWRSPFSVSTRADAKSGWLSYHSLTYGGGFEPWTSNWIFTVFPFATGKLYVPLSSVRPPQRNQQHGRAASYTSTKMRPTPVRETSSTTVPWMRTNGVSAASTWESPVNDLAGADSN